MRKTACAYLVEAIQVPKVRRGCSELFRTPVIHGVNY
jgi:hypothetical protein